MKKNLLSIGLVTGAVLFSAYARASSHEYRFPDGTQIKVHYSEATLRAFGADDSFASSVLDAAVSAYQTLTEFEGFNREGYSFASPDRRYAYDPDQTIDIYLGDPQGGNWFDELGAKNKLFKDAPCFDTRKTGPAQYEAMILLPANYEQFIRSWEKMNPSPLGKRNVHVDLRGTLIHEMTHVILFYYNKNLNKDMENVQDAGTGAASHLDWYVEGLARYFETFAGARHDFFSQGFKETLADKIRFSRGGSNYYMRYPDQAFTNLRYENALFWRFIHMRFGMSAIEELSRGLRGSEGAQKDLEKITGMSYETLLTEYAATVLLGEFGLKEDSGYLHEIARTRLFVENGSFYLMDGNDTAHELGPVCRTDWIGKWEEVRAALYEPPAAGDSTDQADVSPWATDYLEIRFGAREMSAPSLEIRHRGEGRPLHWQVFLFTRGGSMIHKKPEVLSSRHDAVLDLEALLSEHAMTLADVDRTVLAVTNTDPVRTAGYEILLAD